MVECTVLRSQTLYITFCSEQLKQICDRVLMNTGHCFCFVSFVTFDTGVTGKKERCGHAYKACVHDRIGEHLLLFVPGLTVFVSFWNMIQVVS